MEPQDFLKKNGLAFSLPSRQDGMSQKKVFSLPMTGLII